MLRPATLHAAVSVTALVTVVAVSLAWAISDQKDWASVEGTDSETIQKVATTHGSENGSTDSLAPENTLVSGKGRVITKAEAESTQTSDDASATTGSGSKTTNDFPAAPAPAVDSGLIRKAPSGEKAPADDTSGTTQPKDTGTSTGETSPIGITPSGSKIKPAPASKPAPKPSPSLAPSPAPVPTPSNRPIEPAPGPGGGNPAQDFTITGDYGPLYPGVPHAMTLTITNPNHFAINVTGLSAVVGDPTGGQQGCTKDHLVPLAFAGKAPVAARDRGPVEVIVMLSPDSPNACKGASFPLTYSGQAVQQ